MAQPYRFRPAFGQVKSLFRGARKDTYPLFSAAASDYFARLDAAGLRVTTYDKANARLIDRLVANGGNFWPDSGAFCAMAGYLYPGSGTLIPLHPNHDAGTLNAFVTGDWNAVTGLKGDGSTKYVDSNRNNNADGQNDFAMGVYIVDAISTGSTGIGIMGARSSDSATSSMILTFDNKYIYRNRSNLQNNPTSPLDATLVTGHIAMSRANSANFDIRESGSTENAIRPSVDNSSDNIFIFVRNQSGSAYGLFADARLPFYHIGPNLNGAGELAELDSILTDWQSDLANA